jgi:hypothetical protein
MLKRSRNKKYEILNYFRGGYINIDQNNSLLKSSCGNNNPSKIDWNKFKFAVFGMNIISHKESAYGIFLLRLFFPFYSGLSISLSFFHIFSFFLFLPLSSSLFFLSLFYYSYSYSYSYTYSYSYFFLFLTF